jgi:hypothetical protein
MLFGWRTSNRGTGPRSGAGSCEAGMQLWVGLGVIADNLINISCALVKQSLPKAGGQGHALGDMMAADHQRAAAA